MRSPLHRALAPAVCLAILAAMLLEQSTHATAASAEPYHAAVRTAIEEIPWTLEGGNWAARATPLTEPALRLLRPNAWLSRFYEYTGSDPRLDHLGGSLLIVQCQLTGDMLGHYPGNCYPSNGWEMLGAPVVSMRSIAGRAIPASEYRFRRLDGGRQYTQWVLNFLVVPGRGIFPDIQEVDRAAEDYQQRYYGAAQFQVICNDALSSRDKDRVVEALIASASPALRTMLSGGPK